MLVVSRKKNEVIMLGDNIRLVVVQIKGEKVRLGIEAPLEMPVHRQEVYDDIQRDNDDRNSDSA
jgi:carbon storage regulator